MTATVNANRLRRRANAVTGLMKGVLHDAQQLADDVQASQTRKDDLQAKAQALKTALDEWCQSAREACAENGIILVASNPGEKDDN